MCSQLAWRLALETKAGPSATCDTDQEAEGPHELKFLRMNQVSGSGAQKIPHFKQYLQVIIILAEIQEPLFYTNPFARQATYFNPTYNQNVCNVYLGLPPILKLDCLGFFF